MAVVSITRLRVRSWRYLLPFVVLALRVSLQAKSARGVIAVSFLNEARNTFWTRTVWITEAAMKDFMLAEPHEQAMRRLLEWCDEAAVARWEQDSNEEPDWREAHRRLQQEGRPSKVNHPSPEHAKFEIRAPK